MTVHTFNSIIKGDTSKLQKNLECNFTRCIFLVPEGAVVQQSLLDEYNIVYAGDTIESLRDAVQYGYNHILVVTPKTLPLLSKLDTRDFETYNIYPKRHQKRAEFAENSTVVTVFRSNKNLEVPKDFFTLPLNAVSKHVLVDPIGLNKPFSVNMNALNNKDFTVGYDNIILVTSENAKRDYVNNDAINVASVAQHGWDQAFNPYNMAHDRPIAVATMNDLELLNYSVVSNTTLIVFDYWLPVDYEFVAYKVNKIRNDAKLLENERGKEMENKISNLEATGLDRLPVSERRKLIETLQNTLDEVLNLNDLDTFVDQEDISKQFELYVSIGDKKYPITSLRQNSAKNHIYLIAEE